MTRRGLRLPDVLDDASQLVTLVAAPWVGVLWLTALPVRLLQADFAAQLIELGAEARDYGDHLTELATLVFVAFVVSLAGRALFVHACYLRLHSRAADSARTLRLPVAGTFCYFYAAILIEALFYLLAFSLVAVPLIAPISTSDMLPSFRHSWLTTESLAT